MIWRRKLDPNRVVREHGPRVHAHLKRIFGPQSDVDDVFQSVFVEVFRALPTFEGRSKLSTWIHQITVHVAYQEMRLGYRTPRTVAEDEAPEAAADLDVHHELEAAEARAVLYEALEQLPPKQRMAVVLHDIEGMTLQQVADYLGKPLQTVAYQAQAGRARLGKLVRRRFSAQPGARADTTPQRRLR